MSDKNLVLDYYKNLKLDNTEMDTSLAQVYLNKHNKTFKCITNKDYTSTITTLDNANNKIFCIDDCKSIVNTFYKFEIHCLQNVSAIIRRNAELFAQLEFMIRGIPQKHVKKYDVNIMADQFEYASYAVIACSYEGCYTTNQRSIVMTENLPLCTLMRAAVVWTQGYTVYIHTTKNTAAVCILFAELCFEAGIPKNKLNVVNYSDDAPLKLFTIKNSSSIAVFTEHGDIESGVDVVSDVPTESVYPWRLRRIIVQENTYERFKRSVRSKVGSLNLRKLPIEEIVKTPELVDLSTYIPDLLEKSKDILYYRHKLLAFDYAGCLGDTAHTRIVLVDTYRTTKELLCLMRRYKPRYLSLWCDQISTANEIVFGLDVPNVWLNDFGLFSGPGGVAETFLKNQDYDKEDVSSEHEVSKEIIKSLKWNTFSIKQRKLALENALQKIYDTGHHSLPEDKDLVINYVRTWNDNSSLTVRDGVLCQQIKLPVGVIQCINLRDNLLDVIKTLLIGNILRYRNGEMFNEVSLEIFSSHDIPIKKTDLLKLKKILYCLDNQFFISHSNRDSYLFLTKTIWSSFGETFAN